MINQFKLIYHLFFLLLLHPVFILHFLEYSRHKLLKIIEISNFPLFLWVGFLVRQIHQIVDHSHNEIVIVAFFPILKHDVCVIKIIIIQRFYVVHLADNLLQFFIDLGRLSKRVFGLKVINDIFFDVGIDHLYLFGRETALLS